MTTCLQKRASILLRLQVFHFAHDALTNSNIQIGEPLDYHQLKPRSWWRNGTWLEEIKELLLTLSLDTNKPSGPDDICMRMSKETAAAIAPSLTTLFNSLIKYGVIPYELMLSIKCSTYLKVQASNYDSQQDPWKNIYNSMLE